MAYTEIDKPSDYLRIQTWSGNNSADREITWTETDNMQPDWIWVKRRSDTANHRLADSVRGATKILRSDTNGAETTESDDTLSFDTNGFSVGSNSGVNKTGDTYVGWGWKAGTSFTNDASSTGIGTIDSAGSFNNDSGFSIVSYTNTNQSANSGVATIKHGLNTTPNVLILKDRDATSDWQVFHSSLPTNKYLDLNTTDAAAVDTNVWNNTAPTSSVFTVGDNSYSNPANRAMIAYCFAEKKGYSKFGSYTGNGNADGTFVYTGFLPSFVMVKDSSNAGYNWMMYDNKRLGYNGGSRYLIANQNYAESGSSDNLMDFTSNGFKLRIADQNINRTHTYLYMCFAENPFTSSAGTPVTAR